MLSNIKMDIVFTNYQQRLAAHQELMRLFQSQNIDGYTNLALGISLPEGNYSASEHNLGPHVLSHNRKESVFNLASQLIVLHNAHHVPQTIYQTNMPYLRISLGSEMAMMLNPDKFWVGNVRTIYTHLLLKHRGNRAIADEELRLYKEPDGRRPSEMEYKIWRDLYLSLENSLQQIASMGNEEANNQSAPVGDHVYMWADAISSHVYANHS
ncbi:MULTISPECIES: hypothetical protein [Methylobacter]